MKPGSLIRIAVGDLDEDGAGVAHVVDGVDDVAVHVPGALPGEQISASVNQVSRHRPVAWASLRTIHHASPNRVAPACQAYGRCGGCSLQHFEVHAQLAWKEASLRRLVGADPVLGAFPINAAVPSPLALGYRNNAKLVAARDGIGQLVLGAFAPRSHDVVDLSGCAVVEPVLGDAATVLREVLSAHHVEPYDEIRLVGALRYAILRANASGQVLITLVTATDALAAGAAVVAALGNALPNLIGIVQNVNPTRGNALYGSTQRTLAGEATLEDEIGGFRLRISSRAFFQANRRVAHAAYDAIAAAVAPAGTETVVDAYAGVGGIALTLARSGATVIGIEEHPAAVEDANWSARRNGITNATFRAGDVAAHLDTLDAADVVVLNPPRKGCAPEVLHRIAALHPRAIAYLSCAPRTLLRDLTILSRLGYRGVALTPFDMLPHTPHLEALAILIR